MSPPNTVTNGAGQALFTFTNHTAGVTKVIQASVPGCCASNTLTKTWFAGPARTVTLTPPSAQNTVGTSHTVTATARDQFGNPTFGGAVDFQVTSGAGAVPPVWSTAFDVNGEATFTFTNTMAVTNTIQAFTSCCPPSNVVTKRWVAGLPATLTLSPAAATNPVGMEHTVTATVRDAFGNPTPNIVVRFTVTGLEGTTDQCTTDGTGMCGITYTGPGMPSVDAITAYADTEDNGEQDVGEPGGAAEKTWVPGAPDVLLLDPVAATNPVGTEHTVTATVMDSFGNLTSGITVRFSVTSPPSANSASDSCTTDASGQCSFSYTGTNVGMDAITAYADTEDNGEQDVGEPGGAAEKTWTPATPGCPENGGDDDGDDDGLEDKDERLLFFTLLGDRDSDDDGRRDGNDDSDDDGRDDEDEDDDTDDECPNDSDGDGEDDEDEDDDDREDDDD